MKLDFLPKRKPVVGLIHILGEVHAVKAYQIQKYLKRNRTKLDALFVVINCSGGSPVQSQIINEKLKNYCQSKHIKYYTFAEDYAVSGGYLILAGGILNQTKFSIFFYRGQGFCSRRFFGGKHRGCFCERLPGRNLEIASLVLS
jgi:hypothetical protein